MYTIATIATDEAGTSHRLAFRADYIRVLSAPFGANVRMRLGSSSSAPIAATEMAEVSSATSWTETFLDWDAVAGGELRVFLACGYRGDPPELASSAQLWGGTLAIPEDDQAPLAASRRCLEVLVQAALANTATVAIGGTGGTVPIELEAGQSVSLPVSNVAEVQVYSLAAGQVVNWLARL